MQFIVKLLVLFTTICMVFANEEDGFPVEPCHYGFVNCSGKCVTVEGTNCLDSIEGNCYQCKNGFFLDDNKICQPCSYVDKNCITCYRDRYSEQPQHFKCLKCAQNTIDYQGFCHPVDHCTNTYSQYTCSICENGYYYDQIIGTCTRIKDCADCQKHFSCNSFLCQMNCTLTATNFECTISPQIPFTINIGTPVVDTYKCPMDYYPISNQKIVLDSDLMCVKKEKCSDCNTANNEIDCCGLLSQCVYDSSKAEGIRCVECSGPENYFNKGSMCIHCGYHFLVDIGITENCVASCPTAEKITNFYDCLTCSYHWTDIGTCVNCSTITYPQVFNNSSSNCIACGFYYQDSQCLEQCNFENVRYLAECKSCSGFWFSQEARCLPWDDRKSLLSKMGRTDCFRAEYQWDHNRQTCVEKIPHCLSYEVVFNNRQPSVDHCTQCEEGYSLYKGVCEDISSLDCEVLGGRTYCESCKFRNKLLLDNCGTCPTEDDEF